MKGTPPWPALPRLLPAAALLLPAGVHSSQRLHRLRQAPDEEVPRKLAAVASEERTRHYGCRGRLGGAARLAECAPCRLGGPDAPRLYIKETSDGFGSRLLNIVAGMAVAAKHGMDLGGVVMLAGMCRSSHGVNISRAMSSVLALSHPFDLFTTQMPDYDTYEGMVANPYTFQGGAENVYLGVKAFEKATQTGTRFRNRSNIMIVPGRGSGGLMANDVDNNTPAADRRTAGSSYYYTPSFLRALQQPASSLYTTPVAFERGRLSVAVHVRRGDVSLGESGQQTRSTPDEWYYEVVEAIRGLLPDADVRVFSSLEGHHGSGEFDGYRRRNMKVSLGEDIIDALAHFAQAQVLVTAKSAFSHVGALFNPNCVIYQNWWVSPLPRWIYASATHLDTTGRFASRLSACLARLNGGS